jgi:dipeptidase
MGLGGYFERAISLHRTSYSIVGQARPWLPPTISAIAWFGQHAPHASTFTPFYGSSRALPPSYQRGSIYKFSRDSSWYNAISLPSLSLCMCLCKANTINLSMTNQVGICSC